MEEKTTTEIVKGLLEAGITDEDIETALDCGFPPKAAAAQLGVSLARVNKVRDRVNAEAQEAFARFQR